MIFATYASKLIQFDRLTVHRYHNRWTGSISDDVSGVTAIRSRVRRC